MKNRTRHLAAALLAASVCAGSAQLWVGLGTSLNWSDPANWDSASTPTAFSPLWFEDVNYTTGYTNAVGAVNNIVDANFSAGTLNYAASSLTTNLHFYTTLISAGRTLTVHGLGFGSSLVVGGATTGNSTNYTTITGPGTLFVNDFASPIEVQQVSRATLDLSGLDTFHANAKQVWVGLNSLGSGAVGVLTLARTNEIATAADLTAPGILLGRSTSANSAGMINLGGLTRFATDGLVVGGVRANTGSRLAFAPGLVNPAFTLRGSAGGLSRAEVFSIGDLAATDTGYNATPAGATSGTADFTGGSVDLMVGSLYVGRSSTDGGASGSFTDGTGTLIVEKGTLDATAAYVGYKQGTNLTRAVGTLTLRGDATATVANDLSLAFRNNGTNGSQAPSATLNVNNTAVLNVGGKIVHGNGGVSTINLGGGTIGMTSGGSVYASGLTGFGSITNASNVTVTNVLLPGTPIVPATASTPSRPAAPGTLLVGNNLTLGANTPMSFRLGADTTIGGGVNDLVGVPNDLTLNNNPINVTFTAPLMMGTYLLMTNGGTQSGTVTWINPTRSTAAVVQTGNSVGIEVSSAAPATLVMAGSTPTTNWSTTNLVWNGNTEKFYQLDNVLFDDTATATNITLVANLTPGSVTVSNNTKPFALNTSSTGPAWISGFGSLTKDGTGLLLVNGVNNNFYGPVNIKNGTLKLGFANSGEQLGTAGATNPITITSGGALDIANYIGSSSGYGRPLKIAGSGVGGTGAVLCNNPSSGSSLTTAGITLTDDATIGVPTAVRLTLNGYFAPYSGLFDLGNHTLTLSGTEIRINQMTLTNGGTINVNSASLSLQNSIIAGTGDLNLGSKNLNFNNWTTGYVAKPMIVNGGSITIASAGNPAVPILIGSSITMNGGLTITNSQPIRFTNSLTGSGSLVKYGNSNLVLDAANTYNGNTLVNAGTLSLGAAGALASSPLVRISPGATLDVTAKPGSLTLASGQTLDFNGSARGDLTAGSGSTLLGAGVINGSLAVSSGAEVAPGTTNVTGTIVVSNALALNGGHFTWELAPSFEISDAFVVGGNLTLSGVNTFTVNSIGGFDPSGTNTLITYEGTLTGGLANLALNTTARFVVEFVDPALTPGKIQIRLVTPSPLLTWKGGDAGKPTAWDIKTTPNWDNAGSPDVFWNSDLVRFDDTADTNVVDLVGILGPGSVSMENSSLSYLFGGSGSLVSSTLTNAGGSLTFANTANNFFTGVGLVLNGGITTFAQPINATLNANLNGFGTFAKAGNSNLTLIGKADNFGGLVNVTAGTLRAGSSNVLGLGVATVTSGATLDVNGQFLQSSASVTVSGTGADGLGAINNRGAGRTNALANVILAGDTTVGAASNAWGVVNSFQGGGFTLAKTNASDVWIMPGTDTDLGTIDVAQGRLVFSGAGTTMGRDASTATVRSSAVLALATTNAMPQSGLGPPALDVGAKPVVLQANATMESVGFGVNQTSFLTHNGPIGITNPGIFRVGGNSQLTLNGPISGVNGQLIVTNNGSLLLAGTNTYTSNTLVYSGTLILSNALSLPPNNSLYLSNRISTFGNPSLLLRGSAEFSADKKLFISTANAQVGVGGDGTWLGPITVSGANALSLNGGEEGLNLVGAITQAPASGAVSIEGTKTHIVGNLRFTNAMSIGVGSGLGAAFDERFTTVQFDGDNYWTNTTWGRGRIILGRNNALPPNAPIRMGVLSAGVGDRRLFLDLNGFNQTLTSVAETAVGDSTIRFGNSSTNANSVFTFAGLPGVTNTLAVRFENDLNEQLDYTNHLALTVTSGLLALVNTNTYTGPTWVTGGTLLLNRGAGLNAGRVGQIGASVVTVNGTGTIGGNGIINGPVTIASGGTLSPGASVGDLAVYNELTLGPGSRGLFEVNLGLGTNDSVIGISTLALNGTTLVITNVGAGDFTAGQSFKLFDAAIYTVGPVSVLPAVPAPGLSWDTSSLGVDGTLKVIVQPPPPTVSGVARLGDGNVGFTLTGTPGQPYTVRASELVTAPTATWMVLESGTLPSASYQFTDLTATNYLRRFYLLSTP